MTRTVELRLRAIVSENGARCSEECPHARGVDVYSCYAFGVLRTHGERHPACIEAEMPPASACVPSIEGARGLDEMTDKEGRGT